MGILDPGSAPEREVSDVGSESGDGDSVDLTEVGNEIERLAALVDLVAAAEDSCLGVARGVRIASESHGFEPDSVPICEIERAFLYRGEISGPGDRETLDAYLHPLESPAAGDFEFMRSIRSAEADTRLLWRQLAGQVESQVALARLNDLLFLLREAPVGEHAHHAIDGYLASVDTGQHPLEDSFALCRAWTITRTIKSDDAEDRVLEAIAVNAAARFAHAHPKPGVVLPLLHALVARRRSKLPASVSGTEVEALLDSASKAFRASYLRPEVADLYRKMAPGSQAHHEATRSIVTSVLADAEAADNGLLRMAHLQNAARLASDLGLPDLADDAVQGMQALRPSEMDWQVIRSESAVPISVPQTFIRKVTGTRTWPEALLRFLQTDCPSGSVTQNRALALRLMDELPLVHLFTNSRFGAHGLPESSSETDAEKAEAETLRHADMSMKFTGLLLAMVLDELEPRMPADRVQEIGTFLATMYRSDLLLCRSFARALDAYWSGDYETCVHLAAPKIEAGVRALLIFLDEPVYRVEQGKAPGQFPGLGALLPRLSDAGLDKDWAAFLRTLLLPGGSNLRNLVAHGFVYEPSRVDAALVLRALGLFVGLVPSDAAVADRSDVVDRLATTRAARVRYPFAWFANFSGRRQAVAQLRGLRRWLRAIIEPPDF